MAAVGFQRPLRPPRQICTTLSCLKLPRFRRVVLALGDYGSVVTASIAAS